MVETPPIPTLADLVAARDRIAGIAIRTPLIRADIDGREIHLKVEALQPVGSFKIRCAGNALLGGRFAPGDRAFTASAGNFAQGLAYAGRALGIAVTTYVPETAARSKLDALRRLGAEIVPVDYARWWDMLANPGDDPRFVHPVVDADVLAGNGTIALEVLEDLPAAATILTPYGGGGLTVGIAAAARAAGSTMRTVACESAAGAPLAAAFAAGAPVEIAFDSKTFITGMGGPKALPQIWPLARDLVAGTVEVSLAEAAAAVRLLIERHHIVVEGAGAVPVAAALRAALPEPIVCVLSGGHLDLDHLRLILDGKLP